MVNNNFSFELEIIEKDIKSSWERIMDYLRRDLAYIWTDEVKKKFHEMIQDDNKILFILNELHKYHSLDEENYKKEISDVKKFISHLEKIESKENYVKLIHRDVLNVIYDIERLKLKDINAEYLNLKKEVDKFDFNKLLRINEKEWIKTKKQVTELVRLIRNEAPLLVLKNNALFNKKKILLSEIKKRSRMIFKRPFYKNIYKKLSKLNIDYIKLLNSNEINTLLKKKFEKCTRIAILHAIRDFYYPQKSREEGRSSYSILLKAYKDNNVLDVEELINGIHMTTTKDGEADFTNKAPIGGNEYDSTNLSVLFGVLYYLTKGMDKNVRKRLYEPYEKLLNQYINGKKDSFISRDIEGSTFLYCACVNENKILELLNKLARTVYYYEFLLNEKPKKEIRYWYSKKKREEGRPSEAEQNITGLHYVLKGIQGVLIILSHQLKLVIQKINYPYLYKFYGEYYKTRNFNQERLLRRSAKKIPEDELRF